MTTVATTALARASKAINRALRPTGWQLYEVAFNEETGFVRVIAERRDYTTREGRRVTIMRSRHGLPVAEYRDLIVFADGMYAGAWEVSDLHFGRRRATDVSHALAMLAEYIDDNALACIPGQSAWLALAPLTQAFKEDMTITKFAPDGAGFRRLRVDIGVPGIEVAVSAHYATGKGVGRQGLVDGREQQALAERIAAEIDDHAAALAKLRAELEDEQRKVAALEEARDRLKCSLRSAEERIEHLTSPGKQRLFGKARIRTFSDGSVWLLDPVKDTAGFGFYYASLADLWRVWPDLRPIECGQDESSSWMMVESQPIVPRDDR